MSRREHAHPVQVRLQRDPGQPVLLGGHQLHRQHQELQENSRHLRQLLLLLPQLHHPGRRLRPLHLHWLRPRLRSRGQQCLHLHCLREGVLPDRGDLHGLSHYQLRNLCWRGLLGLPVGLLLLGGHVRGGHRHQLPGVQAGFGDPVLDMPGRVLQGVR